MPGNSHVRTRTARVGRGSSGAVRNGLSTTVNGMSSNRSVGGVGLASDAPAQAPIQPFDKSHTALVRRARAINRILAETYPDAHIELDFTSPLECLVATILSAQSTDKRVNLVTPVLF